MFIWMVSSLRLVYFYVSQSVFTFGLLSSPGWLLEYSSTLLFIITLFSLPIRFQVLTLPNASLVDISLMISRHPRDGTRRTIFVGGIAWIEILQLTGCAPVLSILKAETLFFFFFFFLLRMFVYDIYVYTVQLILSLTKFILFQVHVWSICQNCIWLHGRNGRYYKS